MHRRDQHDAWLARRAHGIGASEVPALLIAYDRAPRDVVVPRYLRLRAKPITTPRGAVPRVIAEKAGLASPLAVGATARRGLARERELLDAWRALVARRATRCELAELIVASTIAPAGPQRIMPLVDRHCPRLIATPDAWCDDAIGGWAVVQFKCSYGERAEMPWHWWAQVQAEIAVTGADYGLLVCGEYWAREPGAPPGDGPIRTWHIERDDRAIGEIRDAVTHAWWHVETIRASARTEVSDEAGDGDEHAGPGERDQDHVDR